MYNFLENILLELYMTFHDNFCIQELLYKELGVSVHPPSLTLTAQFSLWINTVSWKCPDFTCPFVLSLPPVTVRSTQNHKEKCHHIRSQRHCLSAGKKSNAPESRHKRYLPSSIVSISPSMISKCSFSQKPVITFMSWGRI